MSAALQVFLSVAWIPLHHTSKGAACSVSALQLASSFLILNPLLSPTPSCLHPNLKSWTGTCNTGVLGTSIKMRMVWPGQGSLLLPHLKSWWKFVFTVLCLWNKGLELVVLWGFYQLYWWSFHKHSTLFWDHQDRNLLPSFVPNASFYQTCCKMNASSPLNSICFSIMKN